MMRSLGCRWSLRTRSCADRNDRAQGAGRRAQGGERRAKSEERRAERGQDLALYIAPWPPGQGLAPPGL